MNGGSFNALTFASPPHLHVPVLKKIPFFMTELRKREKTKGKKKRRKNEEKNSLSSKDSNAIKIDCFGNEKPVD